ncbi:MAG TPA: phosphatase PAP2 family protein [Chitinophagales bacterium]|nr:phosphatase PAP2 family protein [Chitinophagales bacterium]
MKKFIWQNRVFLGLYALFLVIGAVLIFRYEKGAEIIYFSALHNSYSDTFFVWITRLAEAPMLVLIIGFSLRNGLRNGLIVGLNVLLTFTITSFLKLMVFPGSDRPSVYFEGKTTLNFVQGVEIYHHHSFPSGHTSSAFALFFMLSILAENKKWSYLFFTLALLVGISRVYLLEHFFSDVYFGSLTGMAVTVIFYLIFVRSRFFENLEWRKNNC